MVKKITMAIVTMLAVLLIAGAASAVADIQVLPSVTPGDPIIVPVGQDAYSSVGLEVDWIDWGCTPSAKCSYSAYITDDTVGGTVWSVGPKDSTVNSWQEPVHWTPNDKHDYSLFANGVKKKLIKTVQQPIAPVPEIATVGLVGLGLVGLVALRRKK